MSVSKDVKNTELSYAGGGSVNWHNHFGELAASITVGYICSGVNNSILKNIIIRNMKPRPPNTCARVFTVLYNLQENLDPGSTKVPINTHLYN